MPQIINTNLQSLTAQRNLNSSQSAISKAMERLSSGLRINSAKDDAAGLAISNRFSTQVRGLNVAVRNAGDGISLSQTAEGAMGSITTSLQRIRELALQSANATNTDTDRAALNAEAKQLVSEVSRVAKETNFNGTKLLNGDFKGATFQIGANAGETFKASISKMTTDTLGVAQDAGISSTSRYSTTAAATTMAQGDLTINGVTIGAPIASDDNASNTNKASSAISLAATINRSTSLTGVSATADANVQSGTAMTAAATSGTLTINGVTTATISTTADAAASRAAVVSGVNAISAQTGVRAVDTGDPTTGVQLVADDGRNITTDMSAGLGGLTAASTGLRLGTAGTPQVQISSVSLRSATGASIAIGGNSSLAADTGLNYGTFSGNVSQATNLDHTVAANAAPVTTAAALDSGDLVINGVTIGSAKATDDTASSTFANSSNKAGSAISIAAAINRVSGQTGVTADINANVIRGSTGAAAALNATASIYVNGFTTDRITSTNDVAKDRAATAAAINKISGQTGVVAVDKGDGLELTAADGRNISVAVGTTVGDTVTAANIGLSGANGVVSLAGAAATAANLDTAYGSVTLKSGSNIKIEAGSGGVTALEQIGFRAGSYGATKSGQKLDDLDISTVNGANAALKAVDNALSSINGERANLGAVQNRLDSTISNLQVNSQNLTAANSRIQDADFASETANLSRSQVLQQAGISILAQANQLPQQVLSLLR